MIGLGLSPGQCAVRGAARGVTIWLRSGSGYAGSVYESSHYGQWYADGSPISGALGMQFTLPASLEGRALFLRPIPRIEIAEGAGYAGSILRSNFAGQWMADARAVGEGESLLITPDLEGAAISIHAEVETMQSNTIQMFAPVTLSAGVKAGGGQWGADTQQTVERSGINYVTAWPNRFGGEAHLQQEVAVNQPKAGSLSGQAAAIWDKSPAYQSLVLSSPLAAKWGMVVAQFAGGTELASASTLGGSAAIVYLLSRASGQSGAINFMGANFSISNASDGVIRLNGAEAQVASGGAALPLPLGTMSFAFNTSNQTAFAWGLGRGYDVDQNRQWVGSILGAVLLAEVPDTATRQKIEGYYHWKFGLQSTLPAAHPYRASAPRLQ